MPGGIHADSAKDFWKDTLKANAWVMDVIQHGYSLPFHTVPLSSFEKNNASARNNMTFVRQELEVLRKSGVVSFVNTKPTVVSPLTVATNSEGKFRLCLDVSRSVNLCIHTPKIILADLKAAAQITEPGDWQAVYDLSSAYFHVKIIDSQVQFLGGAFENEQGGQQFFVYNFLPFGIASAVHALTKIMKPLTAYFADKGIRHSIYLDDGRIVASTLDQAKKDLEQVYDTLQKSGWTIAKAKSDTIHSISQSKEYLGFIIDSADMKIFMKPQKILVLRKLVQECIKNSGKRVKVKFLAKVLGSMIATVPALGDIPKFFARLGYYALESQVELAGWNSLVLITPEICDSLGHFLDQLSLFNGTPMAQSANSFSLISLLGPPTKYLADRLVPQHIPELPADIFASDASNIAVCAYSVSASMPFFFIGKFSEQQSKISSGHRELLAIQMALEARFNTVGPWESRTNIFWLTDSQNLVTFLTKGSTKKPIQESVILIFLLARKLNINILPIHLSRNDPRIEMADSGSRIRDSDDWSIDPESFEIINKQFGPFTIDLFADSSNSKCALFFSDFNCPGTAGINAFAHSWDTHNLWVCPPVSKILETWRKLSKTDCEGIIIVPAWKSANFWPFLFPKTKTHQMIKVLKYIHPKIIQNQRAMSPLSGTTTFPFLLIKFVSKQ